MDFLSSLKRLNDAYLKPSLVYKVQCKCERVLPRAVEAFRDPCHHELPSVFRSIVHGHRLRRRLRSTCGRRSQASRAGRTVSSSGAEEEGRLQTAVAAFSLRSRSGSNNVACVEKAFVMAAWKRQLAACRRISHWFSLFCCFNFRSFGGSGHCMEIPLTYYPRILTLRLTRWTIFSGRCRETFWQEFEEREKHPWHFRWCTIQSLLGQSSVCCDQGLTARPTKMLWSGHILHPADRMQPHPQN